MSSRPASEKVVLETLERVYGGPTEFTEERALDQVVLLILAQRTDFRRAQAAVKKLQTHYVDWNEVRVTSAYELRKITSALGSTGPQDRADHLRDLLGTIFNRFNKVNLDFMAPGSTDSEAARKRERFLAWFSEKFPTVSSIIPLFGGDRAGVVTHSGLARVLQRLKWLPEKTTAASAVRAAIHRVAPETERLRAQWGLLHLAEDTCVARQPLCGRCELRKHCPSAAEGETNPAKPAAERPAAKKAKVATKARK